tara:strand:+ start:1109 stop:1552 length:444 start_codon:yes stop_codon:yes gene_type:complete
MATINTYLTFKGNCETAFNFYKKAFKSEFTHMGRFKEMPPEENFKVTEADMNKVMHVSLPIGNTILMGSDTAGEWAKQLKQGNNFSVSINADSREEADRLFQELSENGRITMPMNKTFWESYFGMFTDQFGIQWMVSFDKNQEQGTQ